jgi:hypothetical protein
MEGDYVVQLEIGEQMLNCSRLIEVTVEKTGHNTGIPSLEQLLESSLGQICYAVFFV